jgi:glucosamine-phosphate N-acetyltransferase
MHTLRKLETNDYNKGYLELLENLTTVNKHLIKSDTFDIFVKGLHRDHMVYVIEHMDKIIATGTILIEQKVIHGFGKVGHIEDIVVDPLYKGKQLGKLIVNSLTEYAKEQKCYKVILDCSDDVIGFYDKCGFKRKGSQMSLYFI